VASPLLACFASTTVVTGNITDYSIEAIMNIEQLKQAQELVDRMTGLNHQINALDDARQNGEIVDIVFRGTKLSRRIGKDAHHGEITLIRDRILLDQVVTTTRRLMDAEVQEIRSQLQAMGVSE